MNITTPNHTSDEQRTAYSDRVEQARAQQSALWAVAPAHCLTVPRGELGPGEEVLLTDMSTALGELSPHEQMSALVRQGIVLRAPESAHRRNDLAAAETASEWFVVGPETLSTIHGLIESGYRIVPSDCIDGLSGLQDLERRGLVKRVSTRNSAAE